MNDLVREYRLLPSAFPEAHRRLRNTLLLPQLLVIAIGIVLSPLLMAWHGTDTKTLTYVSIFCAIFLTYTFFVSPRRMRRRLTKCWDTYILQIGPGYLLRKQADTPDLRIATSEVSKIQRRPGDYVRVVGTQPRQVIGIPEGIEHFDEVLRAVSALGTVTEHTRDRRWLATLGMAVGFLAYITLLWSKTPWLVLTLFAGLSALTIWYIVFLLRSPNVSRQRRWWAGGYALFLLLCGMKALVALGDLVKK